MSTSLGTTGTYFANFKVVSKMSQFIAQLVNYKCDVEEERWGY